MDRQLIKKDSILEEKRSSGSQDDAIFIGWQETLSGESIALYNITAANHPACGSTVSEKILKQLNIKTPNRNTFKRKKITLRYSVKRDELI